MLPHICLGGMKEIGSTENAAKDIRLDEGQILWGFRQINSTPPVSPNKCCMHNVTDYISLPVSFSVNVTS